MIGWLAYCVHDVVAAIQKTRAHGAANDALSPRDNGSLGQAGGARGINENGHVGHLVLGAVGIREANRRDVLCSSLNIGRESDEANLAELGLDLIGDVVGNSRVDQADGRGGSLDAVNQRLARQVVVDKGGFGTNGPQGEPHDEERVRVLEVHGDNVVWLDPEVRAHPGAVAEHLVVELGIGEVLTLKDENVLVGVALV